MGKVVAARENCLTSSPWVVATGLLAAGAMYWIFIREKAAAKQRHAERHAERHALDLTAAARHERARLTSLLEGTLAATLQRPLEFVSARALGRLGCVSKYFAEEIPGCYAWTLVYERYFLTPFDGTNGAGCSGGGGGGGGGADSSAMHACKSALMSPQPRLRWKSWLEQLKNMHPPTTDFGVFCYVRIHGLSSARHLNGRVVRIVRYFKATKRYAVVSSGAGSHTISIKSCNLVPLIKGANRNVECDNATPGHFIQAILDGSIAGPVFEYRERFGRSIMYRHQVPGDEAEGGYVGWQWSRCGHEWVGCDEYKIDTGFHRGFTPPPTQLAIIKFLHHTRPPPPPITATPAGRQRGGVIDAGLKHLRDLTSQEVDIFFRPRMLEGLVLSGLAQQSAAGHVMIQGQPADVFLTDKKVHDWMAWKIDAVERLTPAMLNDYRNYALAERLEEENGERLTSAIIDRTLDGAFLINGLCARDVYTDDDVRWRLFPGIRIFGSSLLP